MENVDFENVLPMLVLFSLSHLDSLGVIKKSTAKKFITERLIVSTKIGKKHYISRNEILRFLNENTNR